MYALALNVLYVALAYTVFVACLALLLVFVVYGRKLIDSRAEAEPRIIQTAQDHATRVSIDKLLTALSNEEVFAKLADEGRVLLEEEAEDV